MMIVIILMIRWRLNIDSLDAYNLQRLVSSRRFHRLNYFGLLFACLAGICFTGVGSFQIHNLRIAHLAFGGLFFLFMNLCLLFNVIIDWRLGTPLGLRVVRLLLIIMTASLLLGVGGLYFFEGDAVQDSKSVMEIIMTLMVLIHIMTYTRELSDIQVFFDARKLSAEEIKKRSVAEMSDVTPLLFMDSE
jgi:hypothetical protein